MAIWQWDVWIVPQKEVTKHFSSIPNHLDLDWFESVDWWKSVSEKEMVNLFDNTLPKYPTPWAKDTQSWGSNDGDRIELMIENNTITDIVIRIDLRDLNNQLLISLTDFCEKNKFLFFSLELEKFIEPNLQKLLEEIMSSRKMLFIKDPEKFFEDKGFFDKVNLQNLRKIEGED